MAAQLQIANSNGLNLQICVHLFRIGISNVVQHLISAKSYSAAHTGLYDAKLRAAWQHLVGVPITDDAWQRGCLSFRLGGCSFGSIHFRAPAAYLSAWSRTHEFVSRHVDVTTPHDLLATVPGLQQEMAACAAILRPLTPAPQSIPWEFGSPPSAPTKQAGILQSVHAARRKHILTSLPSRVAKARFRSCGGPGAGAFLLAPTDSDCLMDDTHYRIAFTRRLGGCLRPTAAPDGQVPLCAHVGTSGLCGAELDAGGVHATTCPIGGFVIQRHDGLTRWLCKWLSQGRTSGPPRLEQVLPSERGRLDVVFTDDGLAYWCDVAVTSATSTCQRSLQSRANTDGAAARAEEAVKRHRYHGKAIPIVVEADGRPGPNCLAFIRKFAANCSEEYSACPARAWSAFSSKLQTGSAAIELAAWGLNAVRDQRVHHFIP